jgi:hypothetical protein
MYRQSKLAVGVATEDALKDDGVVWSGGCIPPRILKSQNRNPAKKDDRQADRFHGKSGTQKGTTTEILRNPNLLIKTPKKSTDEQTSRQQI